MNDTMLLRQYLDVHSHEAFAELVRRHADWIYHAALRMVRDSHLAEDVTQAVFMVLAKNGRNVGNKPLNAWLFSVTRYSAIHALRTRERQQRRERQAAAMAAQNTDLRQRDTWEELAGRLEDSVGRLGGQDREAVLLRFYQQKSLAEVGAALGVSEDAARKRVARAVGQLKKILGTAEIINSAELADVLMKQTTPPAPSALKNVCVQSHSLAAGGAGLIAKGAMTMMLATKLKIAAMVLVALAVIPSAVGVVMATHKSVAAQLAATTQPAVSQIALALRLKAAANLRHIGQALLLYSNENLGVYPPTLGDLIRTETITPRVFLLPEGPKHLPTNLPRRQRADWVTANADYAYFGFGKNSSDILSDILVAQKAPVPGDTARNLLFADGSVFAFPQALAEKLIAQNSEPTMVAAKTAPTPQELQDRLLCAGTLRHIWLMILLYRYDHADQYPPDFRTLQDYEHLYAGFFACPSAIDARIAAFRKLEPEPAIPPRWIYNQDDYIYTANQPQPAASDATRIIAYDQDKNHGDGVNILFGDGQVRWYLLAEAHEIIRKNLPTTRP